MQNGNAQNVTEPDFRKNSFPAENAENMPEKPVFWQFLEISSFFFLIFCSKMRIKNAQNMTESNFREKFFYGRKWRNYICFHLSNFNYQVGPISIQLVSIQCNIFWMIDLLRWRKFVLYKAISVEMYCSLELNQLAQACERCHRQDTKIVPYCFWYGHHE